MTVSFAPRSTPPQPTPQAPPPARVTARPPRRRGGGPGVRAGQIVTAQAAIALLIAASDAGYLALGSAALAAVALLALSWGRLRGRWLYQWLGVGARYLSRRRALPPGADDAALLEYLAPGTHVTVAEIGGGTAALLDDGYGMTAVLELGDPAGLLSETGQPLPSPASLLPTPGPDSPRIRVQLIVAGVPAPVAHAGAVTSATSYRQLTEGRLLGQERVLLAVRIPRQQGWSTEDLCLTLSGVVRKVNRRLGATPSRALGDTAVLRTLADLAQHDGGQPAREAWQAVHLGGLVHAAFRLTRWPDARGETARRLVPRLLTLPAAATTVSLTAGPRPDAATDEVPVDLVVRLAAVDTGALAASVRALREVLNVDGTAMRRLDGEQLAGFAATLPLGGVETGPPPGLATRRPALASTLEELELPVGAAGLMIGTNRHGAPVLARLFRAEPTRVMLVGSVRGAQLLTMRAMALGARVVVQTARPQVWEPFVRAVSNPSETIAVVPPGRAASTPPGSPLRPLLTVVDVGPVAPDGLTGAGWQATLLVRDELTPIDGDALARADLVVLQQLRPAEAALAGSTLGLGDAANWLTRIRPDMVGVVNRRAVRWALLSATQIEHQLIGPPTR